MASSPLSASVASEAKANLLQVVQRCHNSTRLAYGFVPVVFRFEIDSADGESSSDAATRTARDGPSNTRRSGIEEYEEHTLGSIPQGTAKQLSEIIVAKCPDSAVTMQYESGAPSAAKSDPQAIGLTSNSTDHPRLVVTFPPGTVQTRTDALDTVLRTLAQSEPGRTWMRGWRDERYAIYGWKRPKRDSKRTGANETEVKKEQPQTMEKGQVAFHMERAACALFGVATFGVHCTVRSSSLHLPSEFSSQSSLHFQAYTPTYQIWVPRRSATKSTFPSMLDNSVAGGITAGESAFDSMVRECAEEAGLANALVRERLVATGAITYFYLSQAGFAQPELE